MNNIDYFKERVNFWFYDYFNINYMKLNIYEQDKPSARASTYFRLPEEGTNAVSICYSIDWINSNISKEEIDEVAFHEVCEALLSEIRSLSESRYVQQREIDHAFHRVIHVIENRIFNKLKEKIK